MDQTLIPTGQTMAKKPVFELPVRTVLNMDSGFKDKLLCDGPTLSTGTACVYKCGFCYVESMMTKTLQPQLQKIGKTHSEVVIRRQNALQILREQLTTPIRGGGRVLKFTDPADTRVIYASPLVDVAANMDLVRETIEACKIILDLTPWQIRLLSKSNLLPKIAKALSSEDHRRRVIYGVSTGTLDDKLASVFEAGTPLVSKRLASLHDLQESGFRTFGMLCPSLPVPAGKYDHFAAELAHAIRPEYCEHVWAEVMNVRGESLANTCKLLHNAGYEANAARLDRVSKDRALWEDYARQTFEAHVPNYADSPKKLRFLQYITPATKDWWAARQPQGAILLGAAAHK